MSRHFEDFESYAIGALGPYTFSGESYSRIAGSFKGIESKIRNGASTKESPNNLSASGICTTSPQFSLWFRYYLEVGPLYTTPNGIWIQMLYSFVNSFHVTDNRQYDIRINQDQNVQYAEPQPGAPLSDYLYMTAKAPVYRRKWQTAQFNWAFNRDGPEPTDVSARIDFAIDGVPLFGNNIPAHYTPPSGQTVTNMILFGGSGMVYDDICIDTDIAPIGTWPTATTPKLRLTHGVIEIIQGPPVAVSGGGKVYEA